MIALINGQSNFLAIEFFTITNKYERADYMNLTIKSSERIYPISEGLDALGYIIKPSIIRLRKRNKQRFARKINCLLEQQS